MQQRGKNMVTLLDCIERIPAVIERILAEQEETFAPFMAYVGRRINEIDEIVLIGSGTSYTAAMTSSPFMEKAAGLRTRAVFPNDCMEEGRVYNPNALYLFTSQTGTSRVVCQVMEKLSQKGFLCVSMTEAPDTMLASVSPCHVCLNCGREEYLMRTIGYTSSVLNHMLMAVKLGLARRHLTREQYEAYQLEAGRVPDSHRVITGQTRDWFEKNKRQIMRSVGYELEEGLHGPNYGYNENHCVVVFHDGGREEAKALSLARYMKEVYHNGLVVGTKTVDDKDLTLEIRGGSFSCLEFSAVPQVMAYFLAEDGGRDLTMPNDHSVMYSYFKTHD